ncbi:MAG: hypothetical protein N2484_17260 [Clostridia bacterium]|nr:hypothetical protein [Clostridia bacterium]
MDIVKNCLCLVRSKLNSRNNLTLNILALMSIGMSFLYTILIGRVFGTNKETDIFFAANQFVIYAGYFSQIFYECFVAFYADLKVAGDEKADRLYSTLICQTVAFSGIIILLLNALSFLIARLYLEAEWADGLVRVLSLFILLQNLYLINKNKLNMNFRFKASYCIEIGLFTLNTILIFGFGPKMGVIAIAYSILISYATAIIIQMVFIMKVLKTKFTFNFWHENTGEIVKGSIMVKLGSVLYGFKDVLIPRLLFRFEGAYTAYSYALKFATAVHSVINAPNITVFSSEINYMVSRNETSLIFKKIRSLIAKLALMFSSAAAISYFIIPVVVVIFMNPEAWFIGTVQNNFVLLCVYFMMVVLDTPFMMTLSAFKRYEKLLIVNALFFILFLILANLLPRTAFFIILALCICQFTNFAAYMIYARREIKAKRA